MTQSSEGEPLKLTSILSDGQGHKSPRFQDPCATHHLHFKIWKRLPKKRFGEPRKGSKYQTEILKGTLPCSLR